MNLKPGDTIRYLNAVGGGKVVRVEGKIAYIDEAGFETPVMASECVVVGTAQTPKAWDEVQARKSKEIVADKEDATPKAQKPSPAEPKPIETPEGDVLNVAIGVEASDLKKLSEASFSAYLVNDSNYWLAYVFSTSNEEEPDKWICRGQGLLEPNYEGLLWDFEGADLPDFDRLSLSLIPFKRDKSYGTMHPVEFVRKVDSTKFVKFHCYKSHRYFEGPVIAWDVVTDSKPVSEITYTPLTELSTKKTVPERRPVKKNISKPANHPEEVVIDLHINELLDNTHGMSPADILNYQIDVFRKEMDARLNKPGSRLVFIHGKGNGVLRAQIAKELNNRYKGHESRDASFAEYGFGATEVIIRNLKKEKDDNSIQRRGKHPGGK